MVGQCVPRVVAPHIADSSDLTSFCRELFEFRQEVFGFAVKSSLSAVSFSEPAVRSKSQPGAFQRLP